MVHERRLGDVARQLDVGGTLDAEAVAALAGRADAARAAGVRWLIVDLADATELTEPGLDALLAAGRALRAGGAELIVASAAAGVAKRLAAVPFADRPVVLPSADDALALLKAPEPRPRAKQRVAALLLPRIAPPS